MNCDGNIQALRSREGESLGVKIQGGGRSNVNARLRCVHDDHESGGADLAVS
jgi:hypothetical protein